VRRFVGLVYWLGKDSSKYTVNAIPIGQNEGGTWFFLGMPSLIMSRRPEALGCIIPTAKGATMTNPPADQPAPRSEDDFPPATQPAAHEPSQSAGYPPAAPPAAPLVQDQRYPPAQYQQQAPMQNAAYGYPQPKSRIAAGLLGIFLGGLGIHRFYLGYTTIGIIQVVLTVVLGIFTFGLVGLWGVIEGIMILAGASYFRQDAKGIPLRD
jgi:hypothetical protein